MLLKQERVEMYDFERKKILVVKENLNIVWKYWENIFSALRKVIFLMAVPLRGGGGLGGKGQKRFFLLIFKKSSDCH